MDLRRGSQRAVEKILEVLEANKKLITTSAEIAQVGPFFPAPLTSPKIQSAGS